MNWGCVLKDKILIYIKNMLINLLFISYIALFCQPVTLQLSMHLQNCYLQLI